MLAEEWETWIDGEQLLIVFNAEVRAFLSENRSSFTKDILRAGEILRRLSEVGIPGMKNPEQFKFEDRLSTGAKDGKKVAIYAVKSFKVRIYGAMGNTLLGKSAFLCVCAAIKKNDKADRAILKRSAEKVGEYDAES